MAATDTPASPIPAVLQRPGVQQFVKFCIVGASSTVITFAVYFLLIEVLHFDRLFHLLAMARPPAQAIAFVCGVTNGFIWNNRWTFRRSGEAGAGGRYAKFFGTNVVGLLLNLAISNAVAHVLPASVIDSLNRLSPLKDWPGLIGMSAATVIVVLWNFVASKYWTFKS